MPDLSHCALRNQRGVDLAGSVNGVGTGRSRLADGRPYRLLDELHEAAIELDRRLPEALSPLDVTIGVILAAAVLDVALGLMPAHSNVDAREKVKAWQMAVRTHAATLGVADAIEPVLATWTERAILEEDWTEAA